MSTGFKSGSQTCSLACLGIAEEFGLIAITRHCPFQRLALVFVRAQHLFKFLLRGKREGHCECLDCNAETGTSTYTDRQKGQKAGGTCASWATSVDSSKSLILNITEVLLLIDCFQTKLHIVYQTHFMPRTNSLQSVDFFFSPCSYKRHD